ncbi:hypothetical protein TFLX_03129 [Thermoflexales bacterium]|nr:hypothetical protein TFLX_03129 [Thermoflexales bacterium]
MRNLSKTFATVLFAVAMTLLSVSILQGDKPTVVLPAKADGLGGVINESLYAPLLSGQRYTTSLTYSNPADVSGFGSVQIMLSAVVTGSQVITLTPQFTLQGVACAAVTQWYSATSYIYYQPYSISTSSTTITETVGAWQETPVIEQFSLTGSGSKAREISIQGRCMRVQLAFSSSGQSYTPTVVIRALDRN